MGDNASDTGITRRNFLRNVIGAISAVVGVSIAVPLIGYFLSPAWQKKEKLSVPIARTDSIPVGVPNYVRFEERLPDAWVIKTESEGVWVVTKDGKNFTVFDPHCTHLRCPYFWNDQKRVFQCPCHGGIFDMDGNVIAGPPPRPLDRLEFIVREGEIEITGNIIRG